MRELTSQEIQAVNGGVAWVPIIAGVAIVGAAYGYLAKQAAEKAQAAAEEAQRREAERQRALSETRG